MAKYVVASVTGRIRSTLASELLKQGEAVIRLPHPRKRSVSLYQGARHPLSCRRQLPGTLYARRYAGRKPAHAVPPSSPSRGGLSTLWLRPHKGRL
jgi:hypothetical protein